ncbi:carbamate kinase 1 [bacterium BMS3Abin05]|nr:carbamate kinase 1 [bacterium BMS3Abin05]GBE27097.1 carbamate kinase 1 [bacterium BMS3Bbin03]HDZ12064.1 carbamate kinase [Bacteroidota bacterium]
MSFEKKAVVALGGNAITREFEEGDIYQQFANTRKSLLGVIEMVKLGYKLVLTHGNGPQVGNYLIRIEASRHLVPPLPLGVIVADLEGGMGYMISQSLSNKLYLRSIKRDVTAVLTQVIIKKDDSSILNPTKYVGPFYKKEDLPALKARGWIMKEDPGRGYRRVVPSPKPLDIVEKKIIRQLFESGVIVIAAGGGGIPVYRQKDGTLEGVDAVIDKDLTSAVLAREIGATELHILTAVDQVALNYRKPDQINLDTLTVSEAKEHLTGGQFPAGSMGPKIQAAINFLESGGERVLITSVEKHPQALRGETGTRIVKH